jgi:FG-GAP repeat
LQVKEEGTVVHAGVPNDWHVQGVGDFNGDGNSDVLWRQDGSGQVYVWEMNEAMLQSTGFLIDPDLWRPYVEKRSECDAG